MAAFHLRAIRHGCGLGFSLDEINELEWPDIQRWMRMLNEFLEQCLKPPKTTDETA